MDGMKKGSPGKMTPEETELWIELMEKGLAIQQAVLDSKEILDRMPRTLREDGIDMMYLRMTRCRAQLLGLVGEPLRHA